MGIKNIGEIINTLRKGKGITQEELANHVGVSTQAVSKWECGGVPDTELIPIIADYFEVSIDTLFGRSINDYGDIYSAVMRKISSLNENERFNEVYELLWVIQNAIIERSDTKDKPSLSEINHNHQAYSQVLWDSGVSMFDLTKKSPYALFIPESDERSEWLLNDVDYVSFFKMLSDEDMVDTLIFLYKRNNGKSFTPNLLEKSLSITLERSQEIIDLLKTYNFIQTTEIELNDATQYVYSLRAIPEFIALLTFAREIIANPNNFYIYYGGREKPYL